MTLPALSACLRLTWALVPGLPLTVSGSCPPPVRPTFGPELPSKPLPPVRPRIR